MKHSFLRRHYPYRYKGYNLSHCPGNSTPFSKKVVDSKIRCKVTTIFRNINYFFRWITKKLLFLLFFRMLRYQKNILPSSILPYYFVDYSIYKLLFVSLQNNKNTHI